MVGCVLGRLGTKFGGRFTAGGGFDKFSTGRDAAAVITHGYGLVCKISTTVRIAIGFGDENGKLVEYDAVGEKWR